MIKIAITGPESTAKSSLAQYLSKQFNKAFVPEFAREFLQNKSPDYKCSFEDISFIAKEQMRLEDELSAKQDLIICDTDLLVCKIWQEFVFGHSDPIIEASFNNRHYDLFLLCNTDIKWEYDPLRSNPNDRAMIFELYRKALDTASKPYKIISGQNQDRFQAALDAVNALF